MSVIGSNVLAGASGGAGAAGYEIERSLRFNGSADSAYLNRTPSSAGNRKKFTFSAWVKKTTITDSQRVIFSAYGGTGNAYVSIDFRHDSPRFLGWDGSSVTFEVKATRVLRDPSAWYSIIWAVDTGQSTAANRAKLYINGVEETDFQTTSYPSQNSDLYVNTTNVHKIGENAGTNSAELDAYLADVHFVDGQQLAATDFGETDSDNNWNPKAYSGTYGTNGFHLDFADPADLGDDNSGNGNDWTPNNLVGTAPGLSTANQGFDVVTYTGTGSDQAITGLNFQPDFVWIKTRNEAENHFIVDSVRGVTKQLYANQPDGEYTNANRFKSFDSNGFTVGTTDDTNQNNNTFVAWCWKAGGAASLNENGSIDSQVSANNTYGFSIATYTGTGSNATVGHGLNSAPKFIVVKRRDSSTNWQVYHSARGATEYGALNQTDVFTTSGGTARWNDTAPTSSVFSVGTSANVNANSSTHVAYCWSEVSGFSKFGSFTHPSTTSLDFGFKPRYWLVKEVDGTTPWYIFDAERDNLDDPLFANTTGTAGSGFAFTITDSGIDWISGSFNAGTYIYAAFAAKPDGSIVDSLIDTPTNADADSGNNIGNYCTLNPLDKSSQTNINLSNGNLECSNTSSSGQGRVDGTFAVSSGKWYFEATVSNSGSYHEVGIIKTDQALAYGIGFYSGGYSYIQSGYKFNNNATPSYGATYTNGDTIGVAFDLDAGNLVFYKNGVSQGTAFTGLSGEFSPTVGTYSSVGTFGWTVNFGQRPFAYTPPSNHLALCTQNLDDPLIADPSTAFDIQTYSGTGQSQTLGGLKFSADFFWRKCTSTNQFHNLVDSVRGLSNALITNGYYADQTGQSNVSNVTSTGYDIGTEGAINTNGETYVAWLWDAGSSTVSNTDGSITSSVRANPSAGFSIVTYTGTGSNATIGHGLNAAPGLVIVKKRSAAGSWTVWHQAFGTASNTDYIYLDSTSQQAQNGSDAQPFWNNTVPSSSVVSLGTGGNVNGNTATFVAYCFAPVEGFSAFGSYTGNGNASSGPFVYTGFKPRFLLWKRIDSNENWMIIDSERSPFNQMDDFLCPNTNAAEVSGAEAYMDFLSNGFKIKTNYGVTNAGSSATYIYAAFGDPFKTARAR